MHKELAEQINKWVPNANALADIREAGDSVLYVDSASIFNVCKNLKENNQYQFNVLQCITGCDFPDHIEVSYILASFIKNTELILKTKVPRDGGAIDTVCSVWNAANWQERECFDLLGVKFNNHPDLRRILCVDDWEGAPLKKDYVAQKQYLGMDVYPEAKMNWPERQFADKQKELEKANKSSTPEQA